MVLGQAHSHAGRRVREALHYGLETRQMVDAEAAYARWHQLQGRMAAENRSWHEYEESVRLVFIAGRLGGEVKGRLHEVEEGGYARSKLSEIREWRRRARLRCPGRQRECGEDPE